MKISTTLLTALSLTLTISTSTSHPLSETPTIFSKALSHTHPSIHQTLRTGLTLDPCTTSTDCLEDRLCILDQLGPCPPQATTCVCIPPKATFCQDDSDCPSGEKCLALHGEVDQICVSSDFQGDGSNPPPAASPHPGPSELPLPTPMPGGGLTLDACMSADDCQGDRECWDATNSTCSGGVCVCVQKEPVQCTSSDDCEEGEACMAGVVDGQAVCVSENAEVLVASPVEEESEESEDGDDDNDDPICVDARALSHLSMDELVFEKHNRALVLCDAMESCATPGHIVAFEGRAMRMSSYCQVVGGCVKRKILVNSPRYRRGMRVASNTEGLHYTTFAARYDTRVEEVFLTAAVHVGL